MNIARVRDGAGIPRPVSLSSAPVEGTTVDTDEVQFSYPDKSFSGLDISRIIQRDEDSDWKSRKNERRAEQGVYEQPWSRTVENADLSNAFSHTVPSPSIPDESRIGQCSTDISSGR